MSAYYNENDPKAAAWLRELIKEGHIAPGIVDERSITEIKPHELNGYTQCHFFAGIGGWSLALRLAGWPDTRPVWTGSCPCQPFSAAGKQRGTDDARHLWPVFFSLITGCNPDAIFGEQVASSKVLGSAAKPSRKRATKPTEPVWLDGVFADLESAQYACGAADLPAACIGAPHIRQRAWWVAYAADHGRAQHERESGERGIAGSHHPAECGAVGRMADVQQPGLEGLARNGDHGHEPGRIGARPIGSTAARGGAGYLGLEHGSGNGREQRRPESDGRRTSCGCGACRLADTQGDNRRSEQSEEIQGSGRSRLTGGGGLGYPESIGWNGRQNDSDGGRRQQPSGHSGPWSDFDIIPCRDGKARRVESGTFPLAHGIPHRVGLLRGYGNAIIAELAALFIQASEEARSGEFLT